VTKIEGVVESSILNLSATGSVLRLIVNGQEYRLSFSSTDSDYKTHCAFLPRIDAGERVILHKWSGRIVALQILCDDMGKIKFAMTIGSYLAYLPILDCQQKRMQERTIAPFFID